MTRNSSIAPPSRVGVLGSFLTIAAATLATASHADPAVPFAGVFVEGAAGFYRNDAKASDTNIEFRSVEDGRLAFTTHNSADSKKQSAPMGRLSLGYGYMLPYDINLAVVGAYNTSQKITSTVLLKNVFDVRFQPGYYIVPAHTLIYASLGYARAGLSDSLGRADMRNARNGDDGTRAGVTITSRPSNVFPSSTAENSRARTNGLVLGGGLKFSPAGRFYVGLDYSYIRYQKKTYTGGAKTASTSTDVQDGFGEYDASWTQTVEPRSSNLLLTLGYYFF